jgi:hypothetical protein
VYFLVLWLFVCFVLWGCMCGICTVNLLCRVGFTILRLRKNVVLFDQLCRSRLFCGFLLEDWELACIDTPILFSGAHIVSMKNLARGNAPFLSSEARVFVRAWCSDTPFFSSEARVFVRTWRAAMPTSFLARFAFL